MLKRLQEQLRAKNYQAKSSAKSRYPETEGRYSHTGNCDGSRSRSTDCEGSFWCWNLSLKPTFTPVLTAAVHSADAKMASTAIRNDLYRGARKVVEIDFRSYFMTIPHDKLDHLADQANAWWMWAWLRLEIKTESDGCRIAYEGKVEPTSGGSSARITDLAALQQIILF